LSLYPVIPLSDSIGTKAYRLLKTYAKKHYRMIEGLQLEVPDY